MCLGLAFVSLLFFRVLVGCVLGVCVAIYGHYRVSVVVVVCYKEFAKQTFFQSQK